MGGLGLILRWGGRECFYRVIFMIVFSFETKYSHLEKVISMETNTVINLNYFILCSVCGLFAFVS